MQHLVNKAHTRWVAANLISGHLVHAVQAVEPGLATRKQGLQWRG